MIIARPPIGNQDPEDLFEDADEDDDDYDGE